MSAAAGPGATSREQPTLGEAFYVWLRIGLLSFGGPAGQIALMHRILVEEKRWIDEARFLHALNFCMLLPGPEAQQLATYVGWLLHRTRGGLVAGILFVLPGALVMLALSVIYVQLREAPAIGALFVGIKAAVVAIVVQAFLRMARRVLAGRLTMAIAAAAFFAIYFVDVPFPLIIAGAAAVGVLAPRLLPAGQPHGGDEASAPLEIASTAAAAGAHSQASWRRAGAVMAIGAAAWFAPIAALSGVFGAGSLFVTEAWFFSKLAVVTFGGAYAVLAYMAQQAVDVHQWLTPGQMLDGLGLAETTPGPLIMVVQFVGFLAGHGSGALSPTAGGVLGAAVATWVTFVPCFVWIFLAGPLVERLHGNRAAKAALSAVTAAVVGVILNLAIWFALHVLFAQVATVELGPLSFSMPRLSSLEPVAAVLVAAALTGLFAGRLGVATLIALGAGAGAALHFAAVL